MGGRFGKKKGRPSENGGALWQKEGPPIREWAAQGSDLLVRLGGKRANPAPGCFTRSWLNARLMSGAVSDPARLNYVIERVICGNSLGFDAQRSRSQQSQLAAPEAAVGAAVVDHRRRPIVADHRLLAV